MTRFHENIIVRFPADNLVILEIVSFYFVMTHCDKPSPSQFEFIKKQQESHLYSFIIVIELKFDESF